MLRKCAASMCGKTLEDGIKLFQFPENYTHNWIFAVDRGPNWTPDTNSRLCSDHFPQVIIKKFNTFFMPKKYFLVSRAITF